MEIDPNVMPTAMPKPLTQAERFVNYVIKQIPNDKGFTARLKRADNPACEFYSWELLAAFKIDLENPWERLPYCTIAAALARAKPSADGTLSLGLALAACFPKGNQAESARARLRRLLSSNSVEDLCAILRSSLALMSSREITPAYGKLLNQILWYRGTSREQVRAQWAMSFFSHSAEVESQGEAL